MLYNNPHIVAGLIYRSFEIGSSLLGDAEIVPCAGPACSLGAKDAAAERLQRL